MPFHDGTGLASCLSLLARADRLGETELAQLLRRHARTCRCLEDQRACPICARLLERWRALSLAGSDDQEAA